MRGHLTRCSQPNDSNWVIAIKHKGRTHGSKRSVTSCEQGNRRRASVHGATSTDARRDVHFIAQGENQKKDRFDTLCALGKILFILRILCREYRLALTPKRFDSCWRSCCHPTNTNRTAVRPVHWNRKLVNVFEEEVQPDGLFYWSVFCIEYCIHSEHLEPLPVISLTRWGRWLVQICVFLAST